MKESEKTDEMFKLLSFIYAEWGKVIDDPLIAFWLRNLRGVTKPQAWAAAEMLVKRKTYGEPKLQDFFECLKELAPKRRCIGAYNPHRSHYDQVRDEKESENWLLEHCREANDAQPLEGPIRIGDVMRKLLPN